MSKSQKDCALTAVDILSILFLLIFGVFICLACFVDTNPDNDSFVREIFIAMFGLVTLVISGYVKRFVNKE